MKKSFLIPTVLLLVMLFSVTVSAALLHDSHDISSTVEEFSFTQLANDSLLVRMNVNNNSSKSYRYTLFAVVMNGEKIQREEVLLSAEATFGKQEELLLWLSSLSSNSHNL